MSAEKPMQDIYIEGEAERRRNEDMRKLRQALEETEHALAVERRQTVNLLGMIQNSAETGDPCRVRTGSLTFIVSAEKFDPPPPPTRRGAFEITEANRPD